MIVFEVLELVKEVLAEHRGLQQLFLFKFLELLLAELFSVVLFAQENLPRLQYFIFEQIGVVCLGALLFDVVKAAHLALESLHGKFSALLFNSLELLASEERLPVLVDHLVKTKSQHDRLLRGADNTKRSQIHLVAIFE